ncbi:hypothetical protein IKD98_00580 [Candidatus Saccharibacteria bacterium]|nr:hypothetical protein [Candidatus Saccharibacteria bacterium]
MQRRIEFGIIGGMIGVVGFCAVGLMSSVSHAETTSANATVTVAEACTMTAMVDSAHSAMVNPGQYVSEIGQTTLKVICNDASGYAIYAVGNANNEFGNNKLLASLGGTLSPAYDIATGTATSGNTSNWAMKVDAVSGAYAPAIQNSFGSYHDVPATYTKVAQYASNTDTSTGSSITSTYAAFVKSDQPAGSYNGKVKYTMVHPMSETPLQPQLTQAGKICYYPNGKNVEGTMGCQTIPTSSSAVDGVSKTSAVLLASNYSREGYGFAGWSKTYDYSDLDGFLGPQEYITYENGQYSGSNSGLSLYARWIKSAGNLQGWTGCSSLQSGAVTALTDQRDNETYAVAKLADGNCWMIENMRLENTGTDNTIGSLAQGYNASFAGLADSEAASLLTSTTTANLLYSTDGSTSKTISGSEQYNRFPRYNNVNTPISDIDRPSNPTTNSSTNSSTNAGMYSYGNYYTWAAAIADTTNYTTNNQSVTSTSICPTGWYLPKGGNKQNTANNEFLAFTEALIGAKPANYDSQTSPYYTGTPEGTDASNVLRAYPSNFVYSGSVGNGSVYNRGYFGHYWSSTAYSGSNAYYMNFYGSGVYPGTGNNYKYYGGSIRCLASGA